MISNLFHYSYYNAPTCFDATAPSSGGLVYSALKQRTRAHCGERVI
jgi:hypothetical protein